MMVSTFHSFHTQRLKSRMKEIEAVFSVSQMERVWSKYVREGLRKQEIPDLHDFNDYHWNRTELFRSLNNSLCSGTYTPQKSIPVRVEKRLGVARTLVVPAVEDCIVLQCLVEALIPTALSKQPSNHAFFSRSHGFSGKPKIEFKADYIWFTQWKRMSNVRYRFLSSHKYVCVTDIANYFDNIDYKNLRNILSNLDGIGEVVFDILFSVLDRISWRPDYLPSPERSLPQVNFDAPRLLSHVYLYEVDAYLKRATSDTFVRWVDDITFAVSDPSHGKCLLRDLDQLLHTRGLRLNAGKTQLLTAVDARRHFHVEENAFLDRVKERLLRYPPGGKRRERLLAEVRRRFDGFVRQESVGQAEKVIKRYLTHFGAVTDAHALSYAKKRLESAPGLRESVFRYFGQLGPRRDTFRCISGYLTGSDVLDDASIMAAAKVLTEWHVRPNSRLHRDIRALAETISDRSYISRNPFFLLAGLWLMSKYGLRKRVDQFIEATADVWKHSEFLTRQVAATYPKYRGHVSGEKLKDRIEILRFASASSVYASFARIGSGPKIDKGVRLYVLNGKNVTTYSIQRFLVCLHVLSSIKIDANERKKLKEEVLNYLVDPLYIRVVKSLRI